METIRELIRACGPELTFAIANYDDSLAGVIRSRQAANRPRDIAQLPLLRQTLEEIRKLEGRA